MSSSEEEISTDQIPPNSNEQPNEEEWTLGRLLEELESSEYRYERNMQSARHIEETESSIAASYYYLSASSLRFRPTEAEIPGVARLEAFTDREWGMGLTPQTVRRLRGRICQQLRLNTEQVNHFTIPSAADVLEGVQRVSLDEFQQHSQAMINSGFAPYDYILLPGNHQIDITGYSARLVDGSTPSICPNADPSIPENYLPDVVRAYSRLNLIPEGKTIHWVGHQCGVTNECKCLPEVFEPITPTTVKTVTISTHKNFTLGWLYSMIRSDGILVPNQLSMCPELPTIRHLSRELGIQQEAEFTHATVEQVIDLICIEREIDQQTAYQIFLSDVVSFLEQKVPSGRKKKAPKSRRSKGRPKKDEKEKRKQIRLYEDYKASNLTKVEFLRARGRPDSDLEILELGRKAYEAEQKSLEKNQSK